MNFEEYKQKIFEERPDVKEEYERLERKAAEREAAIEDVYERIKKAISVIKEYGPCEYYYALGAVQTAKIAKLFDEEDQKELEEMLNKMSHYEL